MYQVLKRLYLLTKQLHKQNIIMDRYVYLGEIIKIIQVFSVNLLNLKVMINRYIKKTILSKVPRYYRYLKSIFNTY